MVNIQGIEIRRGTQSTTKLSAAGITVFIDPYKMAGSGEKADIILITHDHFDHCDPGSVEALMKKDKEAQKGTVIIGPESCIGNIGGLKIIEAGESLDIKGVKVDAVLAYNANHTKGKCLGYVITLAGKRIYHAGDTGRIPEMKGLGRVDIALLPVGGTYTMSADEAAAAANEDIKPRYAIPIHYGAVVGSDADAKKFKELCECEAKII